MERSLFDSTGSGPNLDAHFNPEELVEAADILIGVDVSSGHEFLAYGRSVAEQVTRGERGGETVRLLRVELDQATEELEQLLHLVQAIQGRHEYNAAA